MRGSDGHDKLDSLVYVFFFLLGWYHSASIVKELQGHPCWTRRWRRRDGFVQCQYWSSYFLESSGQNVVLQGACYRNKTHSQVLIYICVQILDIFGFYLCFFFQPGAHQQQQLLLASRAVLMSRHPWAFLLNSPVFLLFGLSANIWCLPLAMIPAFQCLYNWSRHFVVNLVRSWNRICERDKVTCLTIMKAIFRARMPYEALMVYHKPGIAKTMRSKLAQRRTRFKIEHLHLDRKQIPPFLPSKACCGNHDFKNNGNKQWSAGPCLCKICDGGMQDYLAIMKMYTITCDKGCPLFDPNAFYIRLIMMWPLGFLSQMSHRLYSPSLYCWRRRQWPNWTHVLMKHGPMYWRGPDNSSSLWGDKWTHQDRGRQVCSKVQGIG